MKLLRVLLLLFVLLMAGCGVEQPLKTHGKKPDAPALSVPLHQGGEIDLDALLGKTVVLNFWATWCPPCRDEIPSMNRAWDQLRDHDVHMLAVSLGESQERVSGFLEQFPIDFPVALDPDESLSDKWPIKVLPTTYVIDAQGRVVYSALGPREWDDPALIKKILALGN